MRNLSRKKFIVLCLLLAGLAGILAPSPTVGASSSEALLWNKLGSDAEVTNSEIGPNGVIIGALDYLPCKFDNGFKPQPRTGDHNLQTNCVRYDGLNLGQKGCIEFWFQPDWVSGGHIRNILYYGKPDQVYQIAFQYNDWQDLLSLAFNGEGGVQKSIVPSSTPEWSTTEPFHVAIVWDGTVANNADKVRLFLNGVERGFLVASQGNPTFDNWGSGNYLWLATRHVPGDWDRHNWEGTDGVMDNIKIWNYAKTDFEDRFTERINQDPIADAGSDQMVHPGAMVILDGSASSDPDGDYPLTYSWQITSKPEGSVAELSDPCVVNPSFVADMFGDYIIELIVTDSCDAQSAPNDVLISTFNTPPVANAGPDQTVYAWIDGIAEVTLDGSDSNDPDGDELTYSWKWLIDGNTYEANSVNPTIELPVGEHAVELVVNDRMADSEPDCVDVNAVAPLKVGLRIIPDVIDRSRKSWWTRNLRDVTAVMELPSGIKKTDVKYEPFVLYPVGSEEGIEAYWQVVYVYRWCRRVEAIALFHKNELLDAIPDNGMVELQVVGQLNSGQYFFGNDTIRIIDRHWWPWCRW